MLLCNHHHVSGDLSAHRSPKEFQRIIINSGVRTQEWLDDLIIRKNQIVRFNNGFRCDWKVTLQELRLAA